MTGTEILSVVGLLVQDAPSETWALSSMNRVKDRIEAMRPWNFLKKLDTSETASVGDTVDTSHSLPSDFSHPLYLYVGSETAYRAPIAFEHGRLQGSVSGFFFVDYANDAYYLTGTESLGGTIRLYYVRYTPDLSLSTSPVWPDRFHRMLPFFVAEEWFAQDQGERNLSWAAEMRQHGDSLLDAMSAWDDKINQMNSASPGTPTDTSNASIID